MSTLRRYRLFVMLLVVPVVVIALIVVLVINLTGGEEEPTVTAGTTPTPTVGIEPVVPPGASPAATPTTIAVRPTQTPIQEPTRSPTPVPEPTPIPEPTPTPRPTGPIPYEVQDEDTLFTISAQFDVSVDDILEFNGLADPDFIFVGQILEIPTDPEQLVARRTERPQPGSAVVIPAEGLNVRDVASVTESTVQYVALGGTQIELTGTTQEIDGIIWYEVEDGNWAQGRGPDFEYLEIGATSARPRPSPSPRRRPRPRPRRPTRRAATRSPPPSYPRTASTYESRPQRTRTLPTSPRVGHSSR